MLNCVCNGNVNSVRYNTNSDQSISVPLLSVQTNCTVEKNSILFCPSVLYHVTAEHVSCLYYALHLDT